MHKPQHRFKAGDIVRYSDGVSALFRYDGTHNFDRLYGSHVLGGAHSAGDKMFVRLQPASAEDLAFCRELRPEWFSAE
jgi:hypothetical protein